MVILWNEGGDGGEGLLEGRIGGRDRGGLQWRMLVLERMGRMGC